MQKCKITTENGNPEKHQRLVSDIPQEFPGSKRSARTWRSRIGDEEYTQVFDWLITTVPVQQASESAAVHDDNLLCKWTEARRAESKIRKTADWTTFINITITEEAADAMRKEWTAHRNAGKSARRRALKLWSYGYRTQNSSTSTYYKHIKNKNKIRKWWLIQI